MTVMKKAFEAHGVHARDVELDLAIAKYINLGGTIAGAQARLDLAAKRMSGGDYRTGVANSDQSTFVPVRQLVEDGEAKSPVPDGRITSASPSSSNREREAMHAMPAKADAGLLPAREPSPQQRSAAATVARALAVTVLDTLKIDGRAIGDWTVGEARAAGRLKSREGAILIEASRVVANAPPNALIRNVVKASEMQRIIQAAAETADAV